MKIKPSPIDVLHVLAFLYPFSFVLMTILWGSRFYSIWRWKPRGTEKANVITYLREDFEPANVIRLEIEVIKVFC